MTAIITKNGTGVPPSEALQKGELAVDLDGLKLYTSTDGNDVVEVSAEGGGGDSLNYYDEIQFGDASYNWTVNAFWSHEEFDTDLEFNPFPTEKHVFGQIETNRIDGFDLSVYAQAITLSRPETGGPSYFVNGTGPSFFSDAISIENTVFGGINILASNAERPDELPFSADEKSIQYALTVSHETLGRTVEIDKEGTIRANAFTDMDGNPIGGNFEMPDVIDGGTY